MADTTDDGQIARSGTIIRAQNGDILRFDHTGMVMVLSDSVIADIARRLPEAAASDAQPSGWIDPAILGDIDAWDVRRLGEWYLFHANLEGLQGPRQFRKLAQADTAESAPSVIADGAGPLYGVLSLGGSRRAEAIDAPLSFPWHVVAPADEVGAAGLAGTETAVVQDLLQTLPETTRDAALADTIVASQHKAHRALSLFIVRAETDSSTAIGKLASGPAYANLLTAIASLKAAADRMDRPAALYALSLDFTLEDVESDADAYRNGVLDLVSQLTADIACLGLRCPPILAHFDCGTHTLSDHPVLRAQWDLAWQGPMQGLHYVAPGYMFRQDRFGRPDRDAIWQMAEMDACALAALHGEQDWFCPIFLLAEREPDATQIRVKSRALSGLVIDANDPFGAGPGCGFSLKGADHAPDLLSVEIAADEPLDLILTFDGPVTGDGVEVHYAFGQKAARDAVDYPAACGALRDDWAVDSKTGVTLHRWALPAVLPVW